MGFFSSLGELCGQVVRELFNLGNTLVEFKKYYESFSNEDLLRERQQLMRSSNPTNKQRLAAVVTVLKERGVNIEE